MIDYEFWHAGPYRFYAGDHTEWIDDARGGRPGKTSVSLTATNDEKYTELIGRYPMDVALDHLKAESGRWLLTKLDEWRVEAVGLIHGRV